MNDSATELFICSFCEQQIKITQAHIGRRIKCPKCTRAVFLYPNRTQNIHSLLASSWYYQRPRLLFGSEQVGPICDEDFLRLVHSGEIEHDFDVSSPQITNSQCVSVAEVNLSRVQEQIEQRVAESQRRRRKQDRKEANAAENRLRLGRAIVAAVSDGRIALREREQLLNFARAAKIPEAEVEQLLQAEARRLLDTLIEECLSDGILDLAEKQRISDVAIGLGLTLNFSVEQSRRLELCDLASRLVSGTFAPSSISAPDISLSAKEIVLASVRAGWHEIVKQKTAVPIGDGHYLKLVGEGDCVLTNKRVVLVDKFAAKKVTLSSIEVVHRFQDGIFCKRSSGKSIFLKRAERSSNFDQFSMLIEFNVAKQPVLGLLPSESFIPVVAFSNEIDNTIDIVDLDSFGSNIAPRYTFRVVGDHVGDRGYWIDQINLGDPVDLVREPTNTHDENAVVVTDPVRRQLGYLKREVASWFGPMLDRGYACRCQAYRKPTSGGLIIAVFED